MSFLKNITHIIRQIGQKIGGGNGIGKIVDTVKVFKQFKKEEEERDKDVKEGRIPASMHQDKSPSIRAIMKTYNYINDMRKVAKQKGDTERAMQLRKQGDEYKKKYSYIFG